MESNAKQEPHQIILRAAQNPMSRDRSIHQAFQFKIAFQLAAARQDHKKGNTDV